MGWGGGLILSNAQKSAATPTHLLLRATLALEGKDKMRGKNNGQAVGMQRLWSFNPAVQ